jgi:predicted nucleotidyltransferase
MRLPAQTRPCDLEIEFTRMWGAAIFERTMVALEEIKRVAGAVAEKNGASYAVLFGSHARGTATERSDIDLIFVEDTEARFLDRLAKYFDPLSDALGGGIECLVYTPGEFRKMREEPFVRKALEEGVVLYESREERAHG